MKFDLKKFNKLFDSGDKFALDYIYDTCISKNAINWNETDETPRKVRDYYLLQLYDTVASLNTCVWLYETYDFKNDFDYDMYIELRNKLFEELGLYYDCDTCEWYQNKESD